MRHLSFFSFFLLLTVSTTAQTSPSKPKLVVTIVADQMRWDYLYRFYERYGNDGFRRLMNDGFRCENAMINYLPAYTAPGHACIYTGTIPSVHGMAGNNWIDNFSGRNWYCVEDTTVQPVGGSRKASLMSPRNLLASTITDELRLATNMRSRVFGIAIKDRGSIIPAGHIPNGAYWFDDSTGNLITSSYYEDTLPSWLVRFNEQRLPDQYLRTPWEPLYPLESYRQSLQDNNPYEGSINRSGGTGFPHILTEKSGRDYKAFRRIPAGNTYTLDAAKACIEGNALGSLDVTDFLALSLSSTDYIGHIFTPNSIEVEDTYLRLDQDLGDFLRYLDKQVGKDNYLIMLTADHGGAHNARYLQDIGIPAGNESKSILEKELKAHLLASFGTDSLFLSADNYQVFLNEQKIISSGTDKKKLKESIRTWLYQRPQVAYVMDMEDLNSTAVPEPVRTMAINGYNRIRSGSMLIVNNPGWYYSGIPTGTTHSTWHPYDTHLPLLWYGWGIPRGKSYRTIYMEDIAPTLAALLLIQMPNGCTGKVIEEMFR